MDGTDGPEPARPDELVTFAEVRAMLGVQKARAYVVTRYEDFPRPWFTGDNGHVRLWRRAAVEAWMDRLRPGWREGR